MSAKDIVEAIATSIQNEVADASEWKIVLHEPIWKNPKDGAQLAIYGLTEINATQAANTGGGGFRTTGYHEDITEIVVEYIEPAANSQRRLQRNEEAELDLYDRATSLREWSDAHEALPTVGVHRFDWIRTSHAPTVRQELLVRFFQLTFQAREVHSYGS